MLLGQQVHLKDGTNDQHRRHLNHAVPDARNAERPLASVALRYPHPQEGLGDILSRSQLLPQRFQPALKAMGVDPFERLVINPRRPRIRATTAIGFKQDVLATDLVPKGVEAEGWFSLSFRLQRGLQLLNRFRRRS
jgi:hypothetical protein